MGIRWKKKEDEILVEMLEKGCHYKEIAEKLERSYDSCKHRSRTLRVKSPHYKKCSPWTERDLQIIRDNHNKKTLPQIYKMLEKNDISYYGFRSKCQHMGLFREKGLKLPHKNTFDLDYWKEPTLINTFLGGFLASDGCLCIDKRSNHILSIKVSIKDEYIIDLFKKELKFTGPKCYTEQTIFNSYLTQKCVYIRMASCNKVFEDLKKHYNLMPKKTKRLGPINLTDKNLVLAYLIGAMDGDGSILFSKNISVWRYFIYLDSTLNLIILYH